MTEKKRMSNFKFRMILVPIALFLLIIAIAANIAGYLFTPFMDDRVGRGERHAVIPEGRQEWDTDYYEDLYAKPVESRDAAYEVALKVQKEGAVLLKNNGVLPLAAGSTVTPFGFRYKSPVYGQTGASGSAKWNIDPTTPEKGLKDAYTINPAAVNKMAGNPAALTEASGTLSAGTGADLMGHSSKLYEYPASIYTGAAVSGTGLVFLGREGAEGSDKKYDAYTDGTPHYFALTQNEKDTIAFAKANCNKVVIIIESSSSIQFPEIMSGALEADAILLVGHVGERGFGELDDILSGAVNPSGRTVAIWPSDFTKDPTYQNFGEFKYTNSADSNYGTYYIDYEEDMYLGYRYYETAHDIKATGFTYGELDGKGAIKTKGAVEYPFGYGLSYTKFDQTIKSYREVDANIEITVRVSNTGSRDGKEVVQLYYNPPYDDLDKTLKIEKPTKTLIAFAKTEIIQAGKYEDVVFVLPKEEMASYCYMRENPDGTKGCYVLTQGDYVITLQKNSHDIIESRTWNNKTTTWFDNANIRQSEITAQSALDNNGNSLGWPASGSNNKFVAATNLFEDSSEYMARDAKILSRANWDATLPTLKTQGSTLATGGSTRGGKTLSAESLKYFDNTIFTFNVETDPIFGNVQGSKVYKETKPVSKADNGLTLSDLRGKDYYDEVWSEWLDQIDYGNPTVLQQMVDVSALANYATSKVDSLGLPRTVHADGANGIKVFKTNAGMDLTATHGMTPLWASTWNVKLMKDLGDSLGKEAMENNVAGWYSPAINLHRSPFSGRNFEYYSEDPVLTGKVAAAVVSGASSSGLYCYLKHFALNDQETRRNNFLSTWASEQAMRELYFKAFEIPFKEAMMTIKYTADEKGTLVNKTMRAATAVMATQSCIGQYYGHADYRLLTGMLRSEWGFLGTVTSDMFSMSKAAMYDMSYRSGLDTFLATGRGLLEDRESPTMQHIFRRIMHNVGYTIANSNVMQGIPPGTIFYFDISPWKIWLIVGDVALGIIIIGMAAWVVLRTLDEKKNPNKYMRRGNNEN